MIEEGKLIYPNGDQFCGKFYPDGTYQFGTLVLDNGDTYFGEFENGLYHGNGVLNDGTEGIYTGKFLEGEKSGIGTVKDIDGSIYSGEFLNGLPHGGKGRQYRSFWGRLCWGLGKWIQKKPGVLDRGRNFLYWRV